MIEVLVSTRPRGETAEKKSGDFIVAKLPGSFWSDRENGKGFQVVELDENTSGQDAEFSADIAMVEADLLAQQAGGESVPIITSPFAEISDPVDETDPGGGLLTRSKYRVEIENLPASKKDDILNEEVQVSILKVGEFTVEKDSSDRRPV
jgi:hypothetical protein